MEKPDTEEITVFMDEHKKEKVKKYKMLNQLVTKGGILFVGSSLMEQFPINELQQTLEKNYIIYNRGVGGFVTKELLASMDECIFELEPAKIFINIGTNDIGSPDYKKEHLMINYDKILSQIKNRLPNCTVYVMAYYPVNAKADFPLISQDQKNEMFKTRNNRSIQEANIAIKDLAHHYHYEFIHVNDGLVDEEGNLKEEYTIEGIHLWPNAYAVILENLKQYL
ncbi:GDSL-type esterase/lipase family protein [Lederbergia sp. NSJ-179]|uniref:GDSL-type esterase/lipase family protein n=1 Tax=Lederbergia sp. NSJ-179 TaxID=2931402 RepID=UPI001FD36E66|nr:GDSL-type esterase/lipase family protein [Lederbergia sp. NSJ-179]MCJ7840474.1 GDSL-type esterase/lipase family protein [Lederbergia sp. NSJ-179]